MKGLIFGVLAFLIVFISVLCAILNHQEPIDNKLISIPIKKTADVTTSNVAIEIISDGECAGYDLRPTTYEDTEFSLLLVTIEDSTGEDIYSSKEIFRIDYSGNIIGINGRYIGKLNQEECEGMMKVFTSYGF